MDSSVEEKSVCGWNSDDIETSKSEGKVDSKKRNMAYLEDDIEDWMRHPETPHPIFREAIRVMVAIPGLAPETRVRCISVFQDLKSAALFLYLNEACRLEWLNTYIAK